MTRKVTVVTPITTGIETRTRRTAYVASTLGLAQARITGIDSLLRLDPDILHEERVAEPVQPEGAEVVVVHPLVDAVDALRIADDVRGQLVRHDALQLDIDVLALAPVQGGHAVVEELVDRRVLEEPPVVATDRCRPRVPDHGLVGLAEGLE